MKNITNPKHYLIGQGLLVIFLWSASKVAMKLGLTEVPPYVLVAGIQIVATLVLALQYRLHKHHAKFQPTKEELSVMIITGVVAFAGANLFVAVGLQYVTGAMAGLIASTTSIFGLLLAALFLQEKPRSMQYVGLIVVLAGVYVFLARDVLAGHIVGIALLLIAEMAFSFGNVMNRLIALRTEEDVSLRLNLVGNMVGALVLIPIAIGSGQAAAVSTMPSWVWAMIVALGIVYAFSGMLWNKVLDKLRVVEVSVLANTMIIQVAILSVIFLGERLTPGNILGGIIVILGAYLVDGIGIPKLVRAK